MKNAFSWSALTRAGVSARTAGVVLLPIVLIVGVLIVGGAPWAGDSDALYVAASRDDLDAFRKALARLPNLDTRDRLDYTPLAVAAAYGRGDAVEMLLAGGAAVDAGHPQLGTPLMLALANGHAEIARVLLKRGADVNVQCEGWDPLASAVRSNTLECVKLVLAAGADPHYDGRRYNVLTVAVDDIQILRYLLAAGADPNLPDADGNTPLINAVESDAPESARLLLLAGADSSCSGPDGRTPCVVARQRDCPAMLKLLDDHARATLRQQDAVRSTTPLAGAGVASLATPGQ